VVNRKLDIELMQQIIISYANADFSKRMEINKQLSKLNRESHILNEKIELIRMQLTELNFNENMRSNQVIVLIEVDEPSTANCNLSYLVSDCG
jgi:hypothetical protein